MKRLLCTALIALALPIAAAAEEKPAAKAATPAATQVSPLRAHSSGVHAVLGKILVRAAEVMPEEKYGFKPVDSVRTFGQIVAHVADSQYFFCSAARGEKNPSPKIEQTKSSKADLVAALKEAFAYCDGGYETITDASASEMVKVMGMEMPRLGVMNVDHMHTMEHYGNLITYLRMNGLVPPTSDPEFQKEMHK